MIDTNVMSKNFFFFFRKKKNLHHRKQSMMMLKKATKGEEKNTERENGGKGRKKRGEGKEKRAQLGTRQFLAKALTEDANARTHRPKHIANTQTRTERRQRRRGKQSQRKRKCVKGHTDTHSLSLTHSLIVGSFGPSLLPGPWSDEVRERSDLFQRGRIAE